MRKFSRPLKLACQEKVRLASSAPKPAIVRFSYMHAGGAEVPIGQVIEAIKGGDSIASNVVDFGPPDPQFFPDGTVSVNLGFDGDRQQVVVYEGATEVTKLGVFERVAGPAVEWLNAGLVTDSDDSRLAAAKESFIAELRSYEELMENMRARDGHHPERFWDDLETAKRILAVLEPKKPETDASTELATS